MPLSVRDLSGMHYLLSSIPTTAEGERSRVRDRQRETEIDRDREVERDNKRGTEIELGTARDTET